MDAPPPAPPPPRSLLRRAIAFFDPAEPGFLRRVRRMVLVVFLLGGCALVSVVAAWSQSVTGRYWTGVILLEAEAYPLAERVVRGLIADDPERSFADYRLLAAILRRDGRIEAQLDVFDDAVRHMPDHAQAHGQRCWYGTLFGDPARVMDSCERSIDLRRRPSGQALSWRAAARARLGDREGAMDDLAAAVEIWDAAGARGPWYDVRREWLSRLRAGEDPFDDATLEALRNEF